jgi:hypothetical protein
MVDLARCRFRKILGFVFLLYKEDTIRWVVITAQTPEDQVAEEGLYQLLSGVNEICFLTLVDVGI